MRSSPGLSEFPNYPVIGGTALLAIGVTVAWWTHSIDISPLVMSPAVRWGELWRPVTTILPHLDVLHLLFNVYWVWVFGSLIEETFGHLKTAALLVLFAVGSSSMDFALSHGGVGLSGVGYAFFGMLWIAGRRDDRFQDAVDQQTVYLFLGWFVFCIFTTVTNILPVANVAHGAGLLLGVLVGVALTQPDRRWLASAGIVAILLFGLWGATVGRPYVNLSGWVNL